MIRIGVIASATEDRVSLHEDADKLDELPLFEATHYILVEPDEWHNAAMVSALYWYLSGPGYDYLPPYRTKTEQNIPEGTIALEEGTN